MEVDDGSLDAAPGQFLSLVGPSGCGKSTILRLVPGLLEPDGGRIVTGLGLAAGERWIGFHRFV